MSLSYIILFVAIIVEVVATTMLKKSEGFTVLIPSVLSIIGYMLAGYLLAVVLKTIPIGIAYAIWAGVGIAIIPLIGYFYFHQSLDIPAMLGIAMIIGGVIVIMLLSENTSL